MDKEKYRNLLHSITPKVIESATEFQDFCDEFDRLILKDTKIGLSQEEEACLNLVQMLLEKYLEELSDISRKNVDLGGQLEDRQYFKRQLDYVRESQQKYKRFDFVREWQQKYKRLIETTKHGYSVNIPEGNQDSEGYVALVHAQHYTVSLGNNTNLRCNAELFIDEKKQGTWRIPPKETVFIERPTEDNGRFTFYELGSKEGVQAGLAKSFELGLIKVVFTPELSRPYKGINHGGNVICDSRGYTAGGTGLSGSSSQSFAEAEEIDLGHSQAVTIHLRLVALVKKPRPLPDYSNPVPPPV